MEKDIKMRLNNIQQQFIVAIISTLLILPSCSIRVEDEEMNMEIGNEIIVALHHYEQDNNRFPASLGDLVPIYIEEIPKTSGGKEFFYSTSELRGFYLSFKVRTRYGCGFSTRLEQWECGYGAD
jgi:hypothetical protein